jgi:ABC-2 type transport system permease protein
MISIAVVWLILYGSGFLLSLLPTNFPTPDRVLVNLPNILRGFYDAQLIGRLLLWSLGVSLAIAIFGMISFSRRDV